MKEVLELIEKKKQEFAQLPLFKYMQDTSIEPRLRLAWAPCAAPFIMSFGDLNKFVLREEPTNEIIQTIINRHTYEDERHWIWFVKDIETLELDELLTFSDTLRFLWGKEAEIPRWLTYELCRYIFQGNIIQKLVVVEAIEATGNVMFSIAAKIGQEIKSIHKKNCLYFSDFHLAVETGHATGSEHIEKVLTQIELTEKEKLEAFVLVEEVFEIFTKMLDSFLVYAIQYRKEQSLKVVHNCPTPMYC
ncbi:hypothetical protein NIES2101_43210 [Calothrix sp. HK-06]|nr:hypothetical protein NIES2101_43210 [Calothrix sp. HK-06]